MTARYGEIVEEFLAEIRALGVKAEQDVSKIGKFPAVIAYPTEIRFPTLDAKSVEMDLEVYVIAPDSGAQHSLNDLGGILEKIRHVVPVHRVTPDMVNLKNHGADPLPALRIETTITHTPDERPDNGNSN